MARSHILLPSAGTIKAATNQYTDGANIKDDEIGVLGEQFLPTYSINAGATSAATAASHIFQIMAGAALKVRVRRIEVYQVAMATAAAIVDFALVRLSTAGTGGTALTPAALDSGDVGAGCTAMTLPTVKGTEVNTIHRGNAYLMQTIGASTPQAQPIYVINFDLPHTKPLIINAGVATGIALKNVTAHAAATLAFTVWVDESPY